MFIKVSNTHTGSLVQASWLTDQHAQHLLAMQVMWTVDITIVKISILTLYLRIFTMRAFIIAAKVTMAFVVAW